MVDFIFPETDKFYCQDDILFGDRVLSGTLTSDVILGNGDHVNFWIYNLNVNDLEKHVGIKSINPHGGYWTIGTENARFVDFNYATKKPDGWSHILSFDSIVEKYDFQDQNKDLVVNLNHHHDGVMDIVQTLNIDYKHKDDKYNIVHDEKGNFLIKKK